MYRFDTSFASLDRIVFMRLFVGLIRLFCDFSLKIVVLIFHYLEIRPETGRVIFLENIPNY